MVGLFVAPVHSFSETLAGTGQGAKLWSVAMPYETGPDSSVLAQRRERAEHDFNTSIKLEKLSGTLTPERLALLTAAHAAHLGAIEAGLVGVIDEHGELHFSVQQGAKAACFAREDAAAGLYMHSAVLAQVRLNRRLLWVALVLLSYIALRVS